jgi:3-dehydroquinate synthase
MTSASVSNPDSVTVPVSLGSRSYDIVIVSGKLESLAANLTQWIASHPQFSAVSSASGKALVVTDSHIASTHAECAQRSLAEAGWATARVELEPGEHSTTRWLN